MKTIQKLRAAMEAIGGAVDSSDYSIYLDAPPGYVWKSHGNPMYHIPYASNSQSWLVKAIRAELSGLKMGLEKVTDPDRLEEIRYDYDDDSWGASQDAPEHIPFDFKL